MNLVRTDKGFQELVITAALDGGIDLINPK